MTFYSADSPSAPRTSDPFSVRAAQGQVNWGARLGGIVAAAFVFGLCASSVLFVDETEYVIVERLGVITAVYDQVDPVTGDRGLHGKLPWPIEMVRRFDRRIQLFDPPAREMFTSDKKNVTVDSYLCWKIAESPASDGSVGVPPSSRQTGPLTDRPIVKFFRGLGNIATCEARLDTRVRSILSSEMGNVELSQLISAVHSEAGPAEASPLADLARRVLQEVRQRPDETESLEQKLGIQVVDIGLKRINLPEANLFAVYERMRKEREKIAQRYRSAGEAEKLVIESQAKRQSEEILARAAADSERIRGEGEAEAIGIRNRAYSRDPEFYRVLRTLESYKKILNPKTTLVLSASSSLLKLLTEGIPAVVEKKEPPTAAPPEIPAAKLPSAVQPVPQSAPLATGTPAGGTP